MESIRDRLTGCFQVVFPELPADLIPSASADTVANWDSAHHFMLMQVVEETFDIQMPEDIVGEIDSFAGYETYLLSLA